LTPPSIPTGSPSSLSPMRREKNGRPLVSMLPNSKIPASCRKKSRFSGKNSENRSSATCCSSISAVEKSVFRVSVALSDGVMR
jgi:hypothetical protein